MKTYFLFLLLALLGACSSNPAEVHYTRVLLVYMAGDNSLHNQVDDKIKALEAGAKKMDARQLVVVYKDLPDLPASINQISNTKTKQVWMSDTLQNAANSETLRHFIDQSIQDYPADHYGLLIFSHADGWLPTMLTANSADQRSIIVDGSEAMEFSAFADALPDDTFDYIVFETCYMASVETAYALRRKAHHLVASSAEIVAPGFQAIYPSSLIYLMQATPDLEHFAQDYFCCWDNKTDNYRSATISVLDLQAMDALADNVKACLQPVVFPLQYENKGIQQFYRNNKQLIYDFGAFIDAYSEDDVLKDEFHQLLERIVLYHKATPYFTQGEKYGYPIRQHSGLTMYIPVERYSSYNDYYKTLEWTKVIELFNR